jgi:hypothetical protein
MSDAVMFVAIFGGLFALRIAAATLVFLCILPEGDRCPNCDAVTIRVQSAGWNLLMPWFRTSWCYECGWDGLLRHTPIAPQVPTSTRVSSLTAGRTARSRGHEST